jgi:L-lactate dehydrogenase (cytochrome)
VLPKPIFGYVSGGCETDASLRGNRSAFADYGFVTRVLQGVAQRSQATTLFGRTWSAPFGIAPMGMCALSAYRGDIALAQRPRRRQHPDAVQRHRPDRAGRRARGQPRRLVPGLRAGRARAHRSAGGPRGARRLRHAGGDGRHAVSGNRENHVRVGFSSPLRPASLAWQGITHPRWLVGTALRTLLNHGMPHFENSQATRGAPILARNAVRDFGARDHLGWEHLRLIRALWRGQAGGEGPAAAPRTRGRRATAAPTASIVSNHGGRQLDGALSPLHVLPASWPRCDMPVMMDSGVRRGNDVLKALALGASFVFVGRPFLYAAAVAGEAGVRHGIELLQQEIHRNMALLGITRLEQVREGRVVRL